VNLCFLCLHLTMSLIPSNANSLGLNGLKQAFSTIKSALDDRDNWEMLASNHEASQVASAKGTSQARLTSGRSSSSSFGGMIPTNHTDLKVKPLKVTNLPSRIPRGIASQVVYDVVKIDSQFTTSATSIVEINDSFSLSQHPQYALWTQLFDQWGIVQASITYSSLFLEGSGIAPVMLYTAIDFDNASPVNSVASIEDFGSCVAKSFGLNQRITRTVRPCVKDAIIPNASQGVIRQWCDSSYPTATHYGLRMIAGIDPAGSYQIQKTTCIVFCFRNCI
jgi:hypothetical protein